MEDKNRTKIIFEIIDGSCNENMRLEFETDSNPRIFTFHRFCKCAALAQGYSNDIVEEYFGETRY